MCGINEHHGNALFSFYSLAFCDGNIGYWRWFSFLFRLHKFWLAQTTIYLGWLYAFRFSYFMLDWNNNYVSIKEINDKKFKVF